MPKKGLEPSRLSAHAPETCASTNSATWARQLDSKYLLWTGEEKETRTPTTQLSLPPQSSASTNSATSPFVYHYESKISLWCPRKDSNLHAFQHTHLKRARLPIPPLGLLERKTRLGLATPTLARLCSTNWAISAKFVLQILRKYKKKNPLLLYKTSTCQISLLRLQR